MTEIIVSSNSTDLASLRTKHLSKWNGATNIAIILLSHIGVVTWLVLGPSLIASIYAYIAITLLVCALHQRLTSEWLHEGLHFNLHPNRRINEFVSLWGLSIFLGIPLKAMRKAHFRHHGANTYFNEDDKDTSFAAINSRRDLLVGIAKDLLGITAVSNYITSVGIDALKRKDKAQGSSYIDMAYEFLPIAVGQILLLAASVVYDRIDCYLYYYISLVTVYPFLSRLRLYGQHLMIRSDGSGAISGSEVSRTVDGTIVDRMLFSSRLMQYHHEHHAFPMLPFRALKTIVTQVPGDVNRYTKSHWPVFLALLRIRND